MVSRPARGSFRIPGLLGGVILLGMLVACFGSLSWSLGRTGETLHAPRRFEATDPAAVLLPPSWAPHAADESMRAEELAARDGAPPRFLLGTDRLGRDLLARCLAGGAISLGVGLCAAFLAVGIGTFWGATAAQVAGRTDAVMMRAVDVLYGLPTILLVVLLAVAADGLLERFPGTIGLAGRRLVNISTLLAAIAAVSWLTPARVIRGQILSLQQQPFMEAARAIGVPPVRQVVRHLLPHLAGPIIVYATLTVPMAILSEAFLSFLGIGVQEPVPSWGNLAADGLHELNIVRSRWWLLLWPCLLLGTTLLALNFLGEWLRDLLDPLVRSTTRVRERAS